MEEIGLVRRLRPLRFYKGEGDSVAKTGKLLALLVLCGTVAAVLATASSARAASSLLGCGDTASHPFSRFLDPLPYTLAPGGDFEGGAAGWGLSDGARVVSGNEPFGIAGPGTRSLLLPEGSSATSPPMCVGLVLPVVRYVASGGEFLSSLKTEVLYRDANGAQRSIELPPGALPTGARWAPTLPLLQVGGLVNALTLNGLTTDVQFRFTPRGLFGGGTWRIDAVYVDPWKDFL